MHLPLDPHEGPSPSAPYFPFLKLLGCQHILEKDIKSEWKFFVLVRLLIAVTDTREKNLKGGKICFSSWFQMFHPMIFLLLQWACGKEEYWWARAWVEENAHLMASRKWTNRKGSGAGYPSKAHLSCLHLPTRPKSPPSAKNAIKIMTPSID